MRSRSEMCSVGAGPEVCRGLLVLGYQGTLAPGPERAAGLEPSMRVAEFPLDAWMTNAMRDLKLRIAADEHECRGECVDYDGGAGALRERLTGILTQALAFDPEANEDRLQQEFPALPALLKAAVAEWVSAMAAFHRRFHRDEERLAAWLGYSTLPEIASLTAARSDAHAGGHVALRLLFRDGCFIYYKPRPISGEWLWDGLVRAVNVESSLRLPSAAVLAGANDRYGWVASLERDAGLSEWDRHSAQAAAYWHAAGATLCLAAQARMTDLHLANILATRQGPAPVDAESLGTPPRLVERQKRHGLDQPVADAMENLLATGLLPIRRADDLPDVSGLFGKAAAVPGIRVPHWSEDVAGTRRVETVPSVLLDHGNVPPGASPVEALPLLVSGYREAAEALIRCRESLLAPVSPWRWTLERLHAPRIVLRDTLEYGLLLSGSLAPELLRSPHRRRIAVRDALRNRSREALPGAVLRAETRDLLKLHIPRFIAPAGSRALAGGSGRALTKCFLTSSPAEAVLHAISELSSENVAEIHIPALMLATLGQRAQR